MLNWNCNIPWTCFYPYGPIWYLINFPVLLYGWTLPYQIEIYSMIFITFITLGLKDSHRTTLNPHHEDNTFDISKEEHDKYFAESIRWNSMYVVACPSKVNGKSYWFLDDCAGDILEI